MKAINNKQYNLDLPLKDKIYIPKISNVSE